MAITNNTWTHCDHKDPRREHGSPCEQSIVTDRLKIYFLNWYNVITVITRWSQYCVITLWTELMRVTDFKKICLNKYDRAVITRWSPVQHVITLEQSIVRTDLKNCSKILTMSLFACQNNTLDHTWSHTNTNRLFWSKKGGVHFYASFTYFVWCINEKTIDCVITG